MLIPGGSVVTMCFAMSENPARKWALDLSPTTRHRATSMPCSRKGPGSSTWVRSLVSKPAHTEAPMPVPEEDTAESAAISSFLAGVSVQPEADTRLVWVVYPSAEVVYVYTAPTAIRVVDRSGELDGGTVLPEFRLPLAELFEEEQPPDQPAGQGA